jgi:hypothetical protein
MTSDICITTLRNGDSFYIPIRGKGPLVTFKYPKDAKKEKVECALMYYDTTAFYSTNPMTHGHITLYVKMLVNDGSDNILEKMVGDAINYDTEKFKNLDDLVFAINRRVVNIIDNAGFRTNVYPQLVYDGRLFQMTNAKPTKRILFTINMKGSLGTFFGFQNVNKFEKNVIAERPLPAYFLPSIRNEFYIQSDLFDLNIKVTKENPTIIPKYKPIDSSVLVDEKVVFNMSLKTESGQFLPVPDCDTLFILHVRNING